MSESMWVFGLHAAHSALESHPDRVKEVVILKGRQDNRMSKLLDLVREQGLKFRLADKSEFDRILLKSELKEARHQGVLVMTICVGSACDSQRTRKDALGTSRCSACLGSIQASSRRTN